MECPPGNVIGHVEQNLNIYRPSFDICDANGDTKYVIEGPSSCKTRCTYFFYCFASFDWVLFGGFFFFLFCYDIYFYLYVYKFPLFTVVLVFVDRHLKINVILRKLRLFRTSHPPCIKDIFITQSKEKLGKLPFSGPPTHPYDLT